MGAVSQVAYLTNNQTATSTNPPDIYVPQGLSGVTTGAMTGGEGSALSGVSSCRLHMIYLAPLPQGNPCFYRTQVPGPL